MRAVDPAENLPPLYWDESSLRNFRFISGDIIHCGLQKLLQQRKGEERAKGSGQERKNGWANGDLAGAQMKSS